MFCVCFPFEFPFCFYFFFAQPSDLWIEILPIWTWMSTMLNCCSRFSYASCCYLNFFAIVSLSLYAKWKHSFDFARKFGLLLSRFHCLYSSIQFSNIFQAFFWFSFECDYVKTLFFPHKKQSANEDSITLCEAHDV